MDIKLFRKKIKALVLQEGGVSSHISILARTYGVPSVFGVENPTSGIETGNTVVVDATKSLVIVEPDITIRNDYQTKQENAEKRNKELATFVTQKAQTKDGIPIIIFANIGTVEDAYLAKEEGAEGIVPTGMGTDSKAEPLIGRGLDNYEGLKQTIQGMC